MSHDTELRDAIGRAILPPRDFKIYSVGLLGILDWKTGKIPDQYQPRSLKKLADKCHMPKSVLAVGLNHLELHKWVERERQPPGRGRNTRYQLLIGVDCDCAPGRADPLTDAERMRRYRARRKAAQAAVTEGSGSAVTQDGKGSVANVTAPCEKGSGIHVTTPSKGSRIHVTKGPAVTNDFAGQTPFPAKRAVRGEGVRGPRTTCDVCANPLDPMLLELGYRTHPCCDPREQPAEPCPVIDVTAGAA